MNYLDRLPLKLKRIVNEIRKDADQLNVDVYLVGGAVRDLILKRENLDLDIVCKSHSIQLAEEFALRHKAKITVYQKFQTATVFLNGGVEVDFALCRKEVYSASGALPKVSGGSLKEDLFRRDITINAMALQINRKSFGLLVDEFNGLNDLKKKNIKILHSKSFIDDPTRILRIVRFEQRFGFKIDQNTQKLLKAAFKMRVDKNVKAPRYFNEFKKILKEKDPFLSLARLHSLGGFKFLDNSSFVDVRYLKRIKQRMTSILKIEDISSEQYLFYFTALTSKLSDEKIKNLVRNFQLSNHEKRVIQDSRKILISEKKLLKPKMSRSEVCQVLSLFDQMAVWYFYLHTNQRVVQSRIKRFLSEDRFVKLEITGDDVLRFDIPEGRGVKDVLQKILYQKVDRKLDSRREELKALKQLLN